MTDKLLQTLSLRAAYEFADAHGLEQEVREIRNMIIEWDLSYDSTVRRGYIISLFEDKGLFEEFKKTHWPFGNTSTGVRKRNWYLRVKVRYEAFLAGRDVELESDNDINQPSASDNSLEFALEAHLRDFLAKNLELIEPGLHLYSSDDDNGVEYSIEGGRIDLLAVDKDGKYVVIELKLSQGRNKTLGQLLYYMGWVDQRLGNGPCRGFIIANELTEELIVAVSRAPGISLVKYKMSFAIEHVAI